MNDLPASSSTTNAGQDADTRRFIVVGADCKPACTSTSWSQVHLYNLVDFDVVILISRTISSEASSLTYQRLNSASEQLSRMLESNGELVVVTSPMSPIKMKYSSTSNRILEYSMQQLWPIPLVIKSEKGQTIEWRQENQFAQYLRNLKRWNFWFEVGNGILSPLLVNREGRALAGIITGISSRVAVLPDITIFSPDEIGTAILSSYGLLTEDLPEPDWADEIDVPGLRTLTSEVQTLQIQIEQARSRVTQLETDRRLLIKYRKLLYSTGDDLELIISEVLTLLGAKLLDTRYSDEDFLIEVGDQVCVVEVTGSEGPLKLHKVRQLLNHAFDVEEKTGSRPKGILIANPLRLVPPDVRTTGEVPEFPANVANRATEMKLAIVSGRWLFAKFCDFREGKAKAGAILDAIIYADGVVE